MRDIYPINAPALPAINSTDPAQTSVNPPWRPNP
ncbi:hypothetical protein CBM2637_A200573 [Cupriavidus taiwanensis]|nr:hypothetical protein CBM2637_A200573 [Cupriavidus taiwanensis]